MDGVGHGLRQRVVLLGVHGRHESPLCCTQGTPSPSLRRVCDTSNAAAASIAVRWPPYGTTTPAGVLITCTGIDGLGGVRHVARHTSGASVHERCSCHDNLTSRVWGGHPAHSSIIVDGCCGAALSATHGSRTQLPFGATIHTGAQRMGLFVDSAPTGTATECSSVPRTVYLQRTATCAHSHVRATAPFPSSAHARHTVMRAAGVCGDTGDVTTTTAMQHCTTFYTTPRQPLRNTALTDTAGCALPGMANTASAPSTVCGMRLFGSPTTTMSCIAQIVAMARCRTACRAPCSVPLMFGVRV